MHTWDVDDAFWGDYHRLSPDQREAFNAAKNTFRSALKEWEDGGCVGLPLFSAKLGVKVLSASSCGAAGFSSIVVLSRGMRDSVPGGSAGIRHFPREQLEAESQSLGR